MHDDHVRRHLHACMALLILQPLNAGADSKWPEYFHDNTILEQIDKDVRRTLSDLAFFQLAVPKSPLSPLSPQLPPQSSRRPVIPRNTGSTGTSGTADTDDTSYDNQNDAASMTSLDSVSMPSPALKIGSLPTSPTQIHLPDGFVESKKKSLHAPQLSTSSSISNASINSIKSRRSIFKRIAHLNQDFGRRDARPASASEDNEQDLHWEAIERILFIYAKLNPGIGYVQGMNEILGAIYFVMANDADVEGRAHAEADSFFCFTLLMAEIRDFFERTMDSDSGHGIGAQMKKLNMRLKKFDHQLWSDLEAKGLSPTYYSFRWLTCLCSQEFPLPEVIRLWDSVFADKCSGPQGGLEFLMDFCCAMILCVKNQLLDGTFADNIKLLQNYPLQDTSVIFQKAYELRQERFLATMLAQDEPSPRLNPADPDPLGVEKAIRQESPSNSSGLSLWTSTSTRHFGFKSPVLPTFKSSSLANLKAGAISSFQGLRSPLLNPSKTSPMSSPRLPATSHLDQEEIVETVADFTVLDEEYLSLPLPPSELDNEGNVSKIKITPATPTNDLDKQLGNSSSGTASPIPQSSIGETVNRFASNWKQRAGSIASNMQQQQQRLTRQGSSSDVNTAAAVESARVKGTQWMRKVGRFVNNTQMDGATVGEEGKHQEGGSQSVEKPKTDDGRRRFITKGVITIDGVQEHRTVEVYM